MIDNRPPMIKAAEIIEFMTYKHREKTLAIFSDEGCGTTILKSVVNIVE